MCIDKPVYDVIIGNIPGAFRPLRPCSSGEGVQAVQMTKQAARAKIKGKFKSLNAVEAVDGDRSRSIEGGTREG